ncbi:peptidase [Streptomyces albus subsp. albus]|nr:peptidase [Streptomyces albus subsp. albus]
MTAPSRRTLLGTTAGALLAAACLPAGQAAAAGRRGSRPAAVPPLDPAALRAAIDDLEHPPATAAQLHVAGSAGRWYGSSGVADLDSRRPVRAGDKVRIGSITKVFVATVVLQLVAEDRVRLDTPVQDVLPRLLPAGFAPITVTQLLNHTSGLPHGRGWPDTSTPELVFAHRFDRWTPERIVDTVGYATELAFTPGTRQEYLGLNYVLLALLVERLTGRPYGDEIATRILRPLRLHDTSVPGHRRTLCGPQVRGYLRMSDGALRDITEIDPSDSWGEGEMISTTPDLLRFQRALCSGALLPARLLREMFRMPPPEVTMVDGSPARYSGGLQTITVNGVRLWGKTGEQYGYSSALMFTERQELRMVLSFNPLWRDRSQEQMHIRVANALTKGAAADPAR